MRQGAGNIGQNNPSPTRSIRHVSPRVDDIVLDKSIFSNIFDKDIRRVFIYKKAERLANALYLISPALEGSVSLKARSEAVAIALTQVAALAPAALRAGLSRELLALSSVLSMARAGNLLSPMNADLIGAEARSLLEEVASYEEPQIAIAEAPTLSGLAKRSPTLSPNPGQAAEALLPPAPPRRPETSDKGHIKDREASIVSFITEKGTVTIKDLAGVIRGVSEKTIQRELQSLIESGRVHKEGERRWSRYSLR